MDLLANLNPQQRLAVTAPPGQTLVLAGPGSGKTRVLTQRIAYLISEMGVPPYRLLAVTFTNKAAREMEARVQALVEGNLEGIWLGTFHAMCARILRRESALLPFKSNFVIMDADDQDTLIKRTLRELNLDEKLYRPVSVHAGISTAKNNLQSADDFPARNYREEVVARVYKRYQELLVANNAVDFDDLLLETVKLLRDNPQVRENYATPLRMRAGGRVPGYQPGAVRAAASCFPATSQPVCGGRRRPVHLSLARADYRNVLRFEEDYRNCQKILLEQNYRSTQTVLDAARAVIDRNVHRTPKHLFSDRGTGERIILYEAVDDHAEAAYVVDTIQQQLSSAQGQGQRFCRDVPHQCPVPLAGRGFLAGGHALPAGGRPALLWPARGQGCHCLSAAGPTRRMRSAWDG